MGILLQHHAQLHRRRYEYRRHQVGRRVQEERHHPRHPLRHRHFHPQRPRHGPALLHSGRHHHHRHADLCCGGLAGKILRPLRHGYRDADRRGRHWPDHDHGDLRGDPHGQDHLPLRSGSGKGRAGGQGVRGQVRRDHHPHLRQQGGSGKVSADRGRDHRQNALHRQELGEAPQRHRLCFQRGHDGRGKGCGRECGGLLEADHYLQEQGHHAGVRRRRDHQGGSAGNQRPGAGQALQNL